jgi:hypothetical protein
MMQSLKPTLRLLLLIVAGVFGVTVLAWLMGADPLAAGNWSGAANELIRPWRWVFMSVRWVLWGLVWWRWAWIGEWAFRGDSPKTIAQRQQWQHLRHQLMGGIAGVEGLILLSNMVGG